MAVKHARVKTKLGFGDVVLVILPGVDYMENHPKIVDVKFEWDYGNFSGQADVPFFGVQFQYNQNLLEPDDKDFLLRVIQPPSVLAWDGLAYTGVFDLGKSAFSAIKSRAPVAAKQLYMWEFGLYAPATSDMWVDITYEIVKLTALEQVIFQLAQ